MDRGSRGLSSRGGHCQCVRATLISVVCVAGSPLPMDFIIIIMSCVWTS